jgi:hypothetical protein
VSKYTGEVTNQQLAAAFKRHDTTGEAVGPLARFSAAKLNQDARSKMRRVLRTLNELHGDYMEGLRDLVEQYGDKREDGSAGISGASPRWPEFSPEWQKLLAVTAPVEIEQFSADELWYRGSNGERVLLDMSVDEEELLESMGFLATPSAEPPPSES